MKLTIPRVYHKFLEYYHRALYQNWIYKPVSWALYQTWKYFDERETPRNEVNE